MALVLGAGCSVINSFDEVKPGRGGNSGEGGEPPTGGTAQGGGAGKGGTSGEGGAGGGTAPESGGGGQGGSAGAPPEGGSGGGESTPTHGLIVVGGVTEAGSEVLVALDPGTGDELARQALQGASVVGLAHDGAGRDAWFIFTASEFPAAPMSRADLQIRRFDDAESAWVGDARVTALPPPRPNTFVVLNQRLAYLSYQVEGGNVVDSLTLLDTSNLAGVRRIQFDLPAIDGELIGLAGVRGAPGDPTALGGSLSVAIGVGCSGEGVRRTCTSMDLLPIFVGDEVSVGVTQTQPAFGGRPAFASAQTEQTALGAIVPPLATQSVRLLRFNPRDPNEGTPVPVASTARWIGGLTFAECQNLAVMTSVSDGRLLAVTPQGLTTDRSLGRRGQGLVYDPFTQHLFAPFYQGNVLYQRAGSGEGGADGGGAEGGAAGLGGAASEPDGISAFSATRTGASARVEAVADFTPPSDLRPRVIAARFPVPFDCQ